MSPGRIVLAVVGMGEDAVRRQVLDVTRAIRRSLRRSARFAAIATLLPGGFATAQEPPDSVVEIEPVVVRVMRSAVGTGEPYAVSVAAGDELQRGATGASLEEALRAIPGLQIQNRFNLASGERIAIRGFGSRAQFGIRSVRVLVDGIPATLPDGQTALDHLDPGSLGRVEMLRGPGAALYGNAAGGVLHFQSRDPVPGPPQVELRSAVGSHGLLTLLGGVSGTSGEVGYRTTLSHYGFDGFRTDPVAADGSAYGASGRTVLNGSLRVPAGAGRLTVTMNALDMDAENPGSLNAAVLAEGDRQAHGFSVRQQTREDIRQGQVGISWVGTIGAARTELAAWGIRREFEGRIPPSVVAFDRKAGGVRALLDGSRETGLGRLGLGVGVEAELQSDDRLNWDNDGGARADLTLDQQERVRGIGLFTQARLELAPGLAASAGLRYDRFRFEAEDRFVVDGTDDSGVRTMHAVSPSVGIVYGPSRSLELFGSLATSFETPTTTELVNRPTGAGGFNPDLEATRGWTIEGGVRTRVGSAWAMEATLFHTGLDRELVPFEVPTDPGRTFFRNAGESHHQGWEVTVEGRPGAGLWTRVAYTRVDGRFDDYEVEGEDFSGNRIPGLAPYRLDGRLTVQRRGGFIEVRGLYQDAMWVNDDNTSESPGFFVADLRAGVQQLGVGALRLSPFLAVANVLDRTYNTSVVVNAFGGRYFEPGPGRTFQLGVGATWSGPGGA